MTFWEVDVLGVDILGVDILRVDILRLTPLHLFSDFSFLFLYFLANFLSYVLK